MPDPRDGEPFGGSARDYKIRSDSSEDAWIGVGSARIATTLHQRPFEEIHEPMQLRGGPGISETTFRAMVDGRCIFSLSHFYDVVIAN